MYNLFVCLMSFVYSRKVLLKPQTKNSECHEECRVCFPDRLVPDLSYPLKNLLSLALLNL